MSKWPVNTLGEIADQCGGEIRTGPFGSQLHRHEYLDSGDGVPVVMPLNMVGGRVNRRDIATISQTKAAEMSAHITRLGDVLLSRRGDIGRYCLIDAANEGVLCGTGSLRVSIQDSALLPQYLCFYLETPSGLHELQGRAVGSTMPNINASIVRSLALPVPPLSSQRKIVAILSAYDDLIENNNRRIKILEEMAQLIYREWFVDFRYPGHEGVPLVDSELGPMPGDWDVRRMEDILAALETGARPKGGIDPSERGVPSVGAENVVGLGRYDYTREKYISAEFAAQMKRGVVMDRDVLLYKDGAYIGRSSLFRDEFPHSRCCVNEHVFILRTNSRYRQSLLYFWLNDSVNLSRIRSLNANSAQPGLNQEKIRSLPFPVPPQSLVDTFDFTIEPMMAALFAYAKAQRVLKETRDRLLPRLISGEVDVDGLNIEVPDAA